MVPIGMGAVDIRHLTGGGGGGRELLTKVIFFFKKTKKKHLCCAGVGMHSVNLRNPGMDMSCANPGSMVCGTIHAWIGRAILG